MLPAPLLVAHAVPLLEIATSRECPVAGARDDHAAKTLRVQVEIAPQIPQIEAHLRIVGVGDLGTVHGDEQHVLGYLFQIKGFVV